MRLIDADALEQDLLKKGFYLAIVKAALESAPTIEQPAWISVEDRLPDDGEEVLLYDRVFRFYELGTYHKRGKVLDPYWAIAGNTYPISDYTHWMPLSQPPKGVE